MRPARPAALTDPAGRGGPAVVRTPARTARHVASSFVALGADRKW